MKYLITLLLLLSATLQAQDSVYLTDCDEPVMYDYRPNQTNYKPGDCNWQGTHQVVSSTEVSYPTLQVAALNNFPTALPGPHYVVYRVNNLWKVYLHPYTFATTANPLILVEQDGFCNATKVNLLINPFPGAYLSN